MDEEGVMYLVFALLMPLIGFTILPSFGKGGFAIVAAALLILNVILVMLMNWADFILFPLVTNLLGITFQPASGYKIVKGQDTILKEINGLYYATGFVTGNLFGYSFKQETALQDEQGKMIQAPDTWERGIMSIDFPFKFHVIAAGLDSQKVRDEYEGKRSYQEFQLSRALQGGGNEVTITDIQRKINIFQTKIDRLSQGERPLASVMYFETTAIGVSEKAALDSLTSQIKALQISMGSMDIDLARVQGRELYTLFKFNFGLPTSFEEMALYFDQQG
ncbi:MAG TPA: hypothetical protein VMV00_01420 [Candidatus Baltobacteraceae bacterium]|nr:hypothetical protein [Candidatus Baltobacteraceae bacterium]